MLLVGGLVLLVAVAVAVLAVLLLGLWRRATALVAALGRLGDRLAEVQAAAEPLGRPDLDEAVARLGERHPDVEILVRRRRGPDPGRTWEGPAGSRQTRAAGSPPS